MGIAITSQGRHGSWKQRRGTLHVEPYSKRARKRELHHWTKRAQLAYRKTLARCVPVCPILILRPFLSLEVYGQLDPDNEGHLFCLHFTYLPIINEALSKFVLSWNNHKIRTTGNKSPLQLFILGMQEIAEESGIVASEYFQSLIQVNAIMHMTDTVPQALKSHWWTISSGLH